MSGKQAFFTAAAEFHQAHVSEAKGKYGETVARLQVYMIQQMHICSIYCMYIYSVLKMINACLFRAVYIEAAGVSHSLNDEPLMHETSRCS